MSKKDDALKLALPDRRTVTAAGDPEDYINSGWNDCLDAIRSALAEQPAQGCEFCSHLLYAGTKCKNCGREQPANQLDDINVADIPKIGCVNHDCDQCKAQQQQEPAGVVRVTTTGFRRDYVFIAMKTLPDGVTDLYTSPPASKPWVGLTDDEELKLAQDSMGKSRHWLVAKVGAKLREKNT